MSKVETKQSPSESPAQKRDPRPTKVLPTNRVAASKQLEIVRAFGAHGGADRKSVSNVEVAKTVGLHSASVGLVTPFLADIGLVVKGVPADEAAEFAGMYEWNPTTAFHRVGPIFRKAWFFSKLEPKLRFKPMNRGEAIQELSIACAAGPSYRANLEMILQYLHEAGLIVIDGENVRINRTNGAAAPAPHDAEESEPQDQPSEQTQRTTVSTSYSRQPTGVGVGAGVVRFNISVAVDTAEFATWEPTRISAFFAGVAQVLAAKGNVEEKTARA